MIFDPNQKEWSDKLKKFEIEELKAFCKEQGFTEAETEEFVKNSIKRLYEEDV